MKVRIFNDNTLVDPWNESFKGTMLTIPPEGLVMNREEAVEFKSQFFSPVYGANRVQDPLSMKMIRISKEKIAEQKPVSSPTVKLCQACGYEALTDVELSDHIISNHSEQMIDDKAKKKMLAAKL